MGRGPRTGWTAFSDQPSHRGSEYWFSSYPMPVRLPPAKKKLSGWLTYLEAAAAAAVTEAVVVW